MSKEPKAPHATVNFFTPEDVGPRDWGREILIGVLPGQYSGKILMMNKGAKGGLQRHRLKDEIAHLVSGRLIFRFDSGDGEISERELGPGDSVHIPPGAVHQEEALEDCVIFEVSTPHFNDRVRMEADYGFEKPEGGLQSTTIDEIETR